MANAKEIRVNKANKSFTVDWGAMPEVAKEFIIEYGLRQKLNDAVSDPKYKGDPEAAEAVVNDLLAALAAGDIRRGGGGGPRDPEKTVALELIVSAIVAQKGLSKSRAKGMAPALFEQNEEKMREKARAEIERRAQAVPDIEIDI